MALFKLSLTKGQVAILQPLFDRLGMEKPGKPGAVIMQCYQVGEKRGRSKITGYAEGGYLSHECAEKVQALISLNMKEKKTVKKRR